MDQRELEAIAKLVKNAMEIGNTEVVGAFRIIERLSTSATEQEAIINDLMEKVGVLSETLEVTVHSHLGGVAALTSEISTQSAQAGAAVVAATGLSNVSNELEGIALASRLLAVNTKIEAAGSGSDSRSIQVIATSIRDLSKSLGQIALRLEETSGAIQESIPQIAAQFERIETQGAESSRHLSEVERVQSELKLTLQTSFSAFEGFVKESANEARDALVATQSFDLVTQTLNAALIRLGTGDHDDAIGTPDRFLTEDPDVGQPREEDAFFLF